MRVTPRAAEVKAIVELLESSDFDSADDLAKAILKRTADLFAERDWYAWVWRENPGSFLQLAWGPYSSENEAKKASARVGLRGQFMTLPLYSTAALTNRLASDHPPSQLCKGCNHQHVSHQHPKIQPKCAVRGCKCRKDES